MLRVHFLNVGHGDCTIIEHPSGRLTMIDINNSQEFDSETFTEELQQEERKREQNHFGSGLESPFGNALAAAGIIPAYASFLTATGVAPAPTVFGGGLANLYAPEPSLLSRFLAEYNAVKARQKTELTDPIEFMKRNYPGRKLWRFILTHPDLDHMRGMKKLAENIGFDNFWDTSHTKETPTFRSNSADEDDWDYYQSHRRNKASKLYTRGSSLFAFGKDENGMPGGDNMEILSPTTELIGACNTSQKSNDVSLVLRVHHAGKSILLPGDAEELAWDNMVNFYGPRLKSDVLKASHHGRDSGYHQSAVKLIAPRWTIVSVGVKPDTDASNKYRQQTTGRVPSTRYHGNIEVTISDSGIIDCYAQRNWD